MRRSVARSGNIYYRNRPIFKRVDPDDPDNHEADIVVTYKFLREQLLARVEIVHLARVRYQVDQIEGALQDELQHELKYDFPIRLHRHKIGPKSDGDLISRCNVNFFGRAFSLSRILHRMPPTPLGEIRHGTVRESCGWS